MLSQEKINEIEDEISAEQRTVDYDTKDYTVEFINRKYLEKLDEDQNEIYVPEYQREFVWDEKRQSRLIESLILGLPIPSIFLAENEDGRLEIVDGSQRIRTISAFLTDELELRDLDKLKSLNRLKYSDLPESRKRKLNNTPLRMIVLSEQATDDVKNDLFDRINRGSENLRNMEKRKGIYRGPFTDFLYNECAKNCNFKEITKLSPAVIKRQEYQELILRYFALVDEYEDNYSKFNLGVGINLDRYIDNKNKSFSEEEKQKEYNEFNQMIEFVAKTFPYGFSKKQNQPVSRVFFEAVSVGVTLALREKQDLNDHPIDISIWFTDDIFKNNILGRTRTHSPQKIKTRVDFIKYKLLER